MTGAGGAASLGAPALSLPLVEGRRPRLVLVEDDGDLCELVRLVTAPLGWDVTTTRTAASGLVAVETGDPDVVVLGLGLPDASGLDVLDALHADERTTWIPVVVLSGDHAPESLQSALLAGAQDYVTKPFAAGELQARLVAALRVATAHRALAEAEERFRLTFEEAPIGIALRAPAGEWLWVNRAMCQLLGYGRPALLSMRFQDLTHPDDLEADLALLDQLLAGEIEHYQMEKRYLHADGHVVWVQLSVALVRDAAGQPSHLVTQLQDITAVREARGMLVHQALHDPLTGLPNRLLLFDRLQQARAHATRQPAGVAVLFLDLDAMKAINDAYGHAAGDALLAEVARRLDDVVRDTDTVARLGGDEFVVVAEAIGDPRDALELAERVRAAIGLAHRIDGDVVPCTASIGVAFLREGQLPDEILHEADQAMYRAKALGKDRWHLAEASRWALEGLPQLHAHPAS
jgi:diguanylate cyclase (GGDEF)-like protein/PAS domain S-box-containing protein